MTLKKASFVVVALCALLLVVGVGPDVKGASESPPLVEGTDFTVPTIRYPGRLVDDSGQAVADGSYEFTFALYSDETGGEAVWSEVQAGIPVRGGRFETALGRAKALSPDLLSENAQWLEVSVRGPNEEGFVTLTPRQTLSAVVSGSPTSAEAASNGGACPHSHWGETWEGQTGMLYIHNTATGNKAYLPGALSGIWGYSQAWGGVHGQSVSNIGVYGQSTNAFGVVGQSAHGYGGMFHSTGNDHFDLVLGGAIGRLNSDPEDGNSQLWLSSNADVVVRLDNNGGGNHVFRIKNSGGGDVCTVNEGGDLNCTGAKHAVIETESHGWRELQAIESPEVWFEDFGTASLTEGQAQVAFESIFAETVNLEVGYHVFVTPLCDEPVLLFVTDKNKGGFTVKGVDLDGEPSACAFDYRVAAKRLGYEDVRLTGTTWEEDEQ